MKPTLGVDVDSTVWDTGAWVREAALEVTGEDLEPEAAATWTDLLDLFGEEATARIHARVLSPERVRERTPYPGAPEVLRSFQEERGLSVHFITRAADPERMVPALEAWLREHFGPSVELTAAEADKLPILRDLGAFGMIDDRPDTLEGVAAAGLWGAAKAQPWNEGLLATRADIHGFREWREVPELLPDGFRRVPCSVVQEKRGGRRRL